MALGRWANDVNLEMICEQEKWKWLLGNIYIIVRIFIYEKPLIFMLKIEGVTASLSLARH
jgi:hypothetical protein